MRLVCPNCGAQYEVDDRVIPESGRDVQCSACGHAWYQLSQEHLDAREEAPLQPADDETLSAQDDEPDSADDLPGDAPRAQDEEPEAPTEPEPEPAPEHEAPGEAAAAPQRRGIEPGVRSILQEEAQRELEARATERSHDPEQVETQPDLGLDAPPSEAEQRRRIARERIARMRGLEDDDEAVAADYDEAAASAPEADPAAAVPRRDLFPDIEEINSTLDDHGAPGAAAARAPRAERRAGGFGRGFIVMIFIASMLLMVYTLAPKLAKTLPLLEPALTAYVEAVNAGREKLDATMQDLIAKIEDAAGAGAGQ